MHILNQYLDVFFGVVIKVRDITIVIIKGLVKVKIGEFFGDNKKHSLVIYDDLSKQVVVYIVRWFVKNLYSNRIKKII
jgi:hypothetical protein